MSAELIRVDAGGWGLTWGVDGAGRLRQVGLGPEGHLAAADVELRWYPEAHPTRSGADPFRPPALDVVHADGTLTTRLVVERTERLAEPDGEHVVVHCRDELLPFHLEHHLRTHPDSAVLEQWSEVHHDEADAVRLDAYDSAAPFVVVADGAQVCQFGGSGWADEWRWSTHGLVPGTLELSSLGGLQPHLQRSPCLLLAPDGPATETDGGVLGFSVAWGGNARIALDLRPVADPSRPAELRVRAGANPLGAAYTLDPGTRFVTPTVAWTWAEGRRELTHRFHRWTVARVLRDPARPRAVVANNWEATFFDFDEARIVDLIRRAADLGAELFLLDDGWFGRSHPRDDDTQGLGDWEPDPRKLPGGLAPLVRAARDAGIRFGIWGEPEMVNPASSAHATHPDRVLRDRREPLLHRNQLVLDTLRPEVRDAAADSVDRIVSTPGISYLKWDANRPITDPGSAALAPDRQQNLWVDQVHATWSLMDEVVRRHPDLELMLCASGGGRTDHGTLARFHEFWTSDNTDPVTRVRIQWACSHFFPARAMAAHVTRWGGRPLAFGCAVALSGRFGVDLDLGSLTPAEAEVLRASIDLAVRIRPLVQGGELIRLVSPVEGTDRSRAALAYRSGDRREAVLFAYQLEPPATEAPALPLDWLDEGATYHVRPLEPFAATGSVTEVATSGDSLAWPGDEPCSGWIWAISTRPDGSVRSG